LGYNSAIAPDGDEWEIRGTRYRNAANGCQAVNRPGYAIQVTLPTPATVPSKAQMDGLLWAIARVRKAIRNAGNTHALYINGHRDVRPLCAGETTPCPGDYLYAQVKNGTIR
jgi:hypothetical protein